MDKIITKNKAYLIGGGIASLSAAAYLIKDGKIFGRNITIFEEAGKLGGSLDAQSLSRRKFFMRGIRIFEEKVYSCTLDLFSFIPSLNDPKITLKEEFFKFNKKNKICSKARLIEKGKRINAKPLKLTFRDRIALINLFVRPEKSLQILRIEDYFTPSFFKSSFWVEFCTVFSFQPWHSLIEFKRYALRVVQDLPMLDTTKAIKLTPYNQYDSVILPIIKWLKDQKVNFKTKCTVENLEFKKNKETRQAVRIFYNHKKEKNEIAVGKNDYVFITLGSITANSSIGSMDNAPKLKRNEKSGSWRLWERISENNSDFGNPRIFNGDLEKSKWMSFTITSRNPLFFKSIKKVTRQEIGTEGPITFKDSHWLITIGIPHQPYFINQPEKLNVCWGYGLFSNKEGNYIKKKMSACNGREILTELCCHLGFNKKIKSIIETSDCVPCMMPYITSNFSPRKNGDRPQVVPCGASNFAFIGQFCEMADDIVFTVEYSVRSAQTAVYSLLKIDKKIPPVYKGWHHIKIMYNAMRTVFR